MRRFLGVCFSASVVQFSGCLSFHSHYAFIDENGISAVAREGGSWMFVGVVAGVAVASAGLTALVFWAVRRWRASRSMERAPGGCLAVGVEREVVAAPDVEAKADTVTP